MRAIEDPMEITRPSSKVTSAICTTTAKRKWPAADLAHPACAPDVVARLVSLAGAHNLILHNPASELDLPRQEKRLPAAVLTQHEVEQVLVLPDIREPVGVRDRAILETFYSTGMRRTELIHLKLYDVDRERGTLSIRQGKGKKDRVIPIGERALAWVQKYLHEARPQLAFEPDDGYLFLTGGGEPFHPDAEQVVRRYIAGREPGQERGLSHVSPHHGHADARTRRRYPLHPADARPRRTRHHADLYAGVDPPAAASPRRHASRRTAGARNIDGRE